MVLNAASTWPKPSFDVATMIEGCGGSKESQSRQASAAYYITAFGSESKESMPSESELMKGIGMSDTRVNTEGLSSL